MDRIEDLRAFVAVIEHGSLTRAAGQLGRSLQSVSPRERVLKLTDPARDRRCASDRAHCSTGIGHH